MYKNIKEDIVRCHQYLTSGPELHSAPPTPLAVVLCYYKLCRFQQKIKIFFFLIDIHQITDINAYILIDFIFVSLFLL